MSSIVRKTEIPGPKSQALMARVAQHTPASVGHGTPLGISHASGALLTDLDGNTYIDFAGGIGTLNAGHCPPAVVEAIREQAGQFLHVCFQVVAYESYVNLAEKLNQITPGNHAKKTLFFNSGAEAVENAVKVARAYTKRPGIVVFDRAFHGRTMMTLAMTGQVKPYKVGFGPFPLVHRVPFPYSYRNEGMDWERSLDALFRTDAPPDQVAAVIVEPVLGEGGFVIPPPEFFPRLREICTQHGILLIADEVQTGFARTGKMFAVEHSGVVPDLLIMAKSLAAGMPLSALTGRADVLDALVTGSLGGTYGGNPVSCAAALAAIQTIESENLVERSAQMGEKVVARLKAVQSPAIGEVRGLGSMVAIELRSTESAAALIKNCMQRGLLMLKAGSDSNIIRTLMPLVITDEQLEEALGILEQALKELSS